jgi:hypothetical protein
MLQTSNFDGLKFKQILVTSWREAYHKIFTLPAEGLEFNFTSCDL